MHRPAALTGFIFFAGCATLALAQDQERAAHPAAARPTVRNLVIVTLDRVRSDHLGCYGYFRDTTPHLDALAQESLRFTRCLTPIAQTTPSHSSLFTGVGPLEHGILSNHLNKGAAGRPPSGLKTSPTLKTLAQALRARGMKTGGFVGATPVKRSTGLDAGFETWSEPRTMRRPASEVIADATRFIDHCGAQPFFAWLHLFDAHGPFAAPDPPKGYCERYHAEPALDSWLHARGFPAQARDNFEGDLSVVDVNDVYDGALRFLDDQFNALLVRLNAADLRDSTALVVIADHGTGLGQHDHITHGQCWDEQFRVPLLIHLPGIAPRAVDTPTSTIDLWPTLFGLAPELADADFLRQCRGCDVLRSGFEPRPLFGVGAEQVGLVAMTVGRWKLIRNERGLTQLFDLEADPTELTNVAAQHEEVVARLEKLMDAEIYREQESEKLHHQNDGDDGPIDPKVLEELRALGYGDGG